ncbi:MAG: hypothetical protein EXS09_16530 [Gemmataceae bacterium]|nr:hypothetical protein [Gemmataceae bacterium]
MGNRDSQPSPANGGFRNWAVDFLKRFLAANPKADGLFLDNSFGRLQTDPRGLSESTAKYADDYASLAGSIESGIGLKWVLANTAGSGVSADPLAKYGISYVEEFALRPRSTRSWHANTAAGLPPEPAVPERPTRRRRPLTPTLTRYILNTAGRRIDWQPKPGCSSNGSINSNRSSVAVTDSPRPNIASRPSTNRKPHVMCTYESLEMPSNPQPYSGVAP